jgi:hypothetical protein
VWDAGERLFLNESQFNLTSANDWALLFSYGQPFGKKFTAGANLKLLYRTLPDVNGSISAWGAGLDAGVTFLPSDKVTLAFVAYDLTTTVMVWETDTREHVTPSFTLGGQYTKRFAELHAVTLALDLPFGFDGQTTDQRYGTSAFSGTINAGGEYWYHSTLALRAGMMGRDLTAGAGLRYKRIGADYAAVFNRFFATDVTDFAGDSDLGVSHRISGSYNF